MGMHVARAVRTASSAAGVLLAGAVAVVAGLRRARKPLHPRGTVSAGRLVRHGAEPTTGVAWLDEPAADDVLVRGSRALGLPRWLPDIHGLTTLLPYRTPRGPLLVGARPRGSGVYDLRVAGPVGAWRPLGRLTVAEGAADDEPVSFDPSLNTVPGLENYGWVVRLRARAYRRARTSRGDRSFQEDACALS